MKIFYQPDDCLGKLRDTVATIGSFDGVHKGHQQILQRLSRFARAQNEPCESVVVTFEPHPRIALAQAAGKSTSDIQLLTTLDEKAYWLERYGVDNLLVVPFTPAFSAQTPESYVRDFLYKYLRPRHLIIGYDHKFGKNRAGDIQYLRQLAPDFGFSVEEIPAQDIDNIAVSSTLIRAALQLGEARRASRLMGHHFQLSGKVVRGQQIGRTIGFPTANLDFQTEVHKLIPRAGIYAANVRIGAQYHKGMLYIGSRPTVVDNATTAPRPSVEVHIFDFQRDIYDQHIAIDVLHFLREESKFPNLLALQAQLRIDRQHAQEALRQDDALYEQ